MRYDRRNTDQAWAIRRLLRRGRGSQSELLVTIVKHKTDLFIETAEPLNFVMPSRHTLAQTYQGQAHPGENKRFVDGKLIDKEKRW